MARLPLNDNPKVTSYHGEPTKMGKFGRHLGTDRGVVNKPFYAPSAGVVRKVVTTTSLGLNAEVLINGTLWRFAHLSRFDLKANQTFSEGDQLGVTGNSGVTTGPHLHYDARKKDTAWDASFSNYYNPEDLIVEWNQPKPKPSDPAKTGKRIYFDPIGQTATFYKVRGGTFAMKIKDATYNWNVLEDQGHRVRVNSASAGGDCWVYITYQTGSNKGKRIPGRTVR